MTFGTRGLRVVHQAVDHARQMNSGLLLAATRKAQRLLQTTAEPHTTVSDSKTDAVLSLLSRCLANDWWMFANGP